MRLIMMGTGGYAVPTFEALIESSHDVAALVTKPAPETKRRRSAPRNPMREAGQAHDLPIFDPVSINSPEGLELLTDLAADLFIVCDYGQILSPEALALAKHGGINLHASLLPKYRGAAPINWALFNGDTETGNTVLHMTPQIDAGPCVAQQRVTIGAEEDAIELEERLAAIGAPLVLQVVDAIEAGNMQPIVQDREQVTRAPRLKKSDGLVDWSRSAEQIVNQIRAMQPWPGTATNWQRTDKEPLRLMLQKAHALSADETAAMENAVAAEPGTVVTSNDRFVVATGEGLLAIDELKPAGKRVLSSAEFLRGNPVPVGDRLA